MGELNVKLHTVDQQVMFEASARADSPVVIDYFPPLGTGQGYTSLELLMASFGSCLGTALLTLLRHRMGKTVRGMSIEVEGRQREEHPMKLERMNVTLTIDADDLTEEEVRKMIAISEEQVCPVWAMLRGNVEVMINVIMIANDYNV